MSKEDKEPIKINLTTLIIILMIVLLAIGIVIYYFASNTTTGKTVYEDVAKKQEKQEKYRKYVMTEENTLAENVVENVIENTVAEVPTVENGLSLEDAKTIITNYFSMCESKEKNPKVFLESLKIVNKFSFTKEEFITSKDGLVHLYKTNIAYANYKTKLLETMSEKMFNENFTEKLEEHNGNLYFEGDIENTGNTYASPNVELITSVGITYDYKVTYKNASGAEESLKMRLVKSGDKYVVDSSEVFVN